MKMRLLVVTAMGMAALICAPAFAQSPPPPEPAVSMQPIANPPETPKMMHAKKKMHHAKKMAKKMAKAEAEAAPPATASPK